VLSLSLSLSLPHTHSHTIIVTDIPSVNLDSLLIQLRPQVSAKWYQFGVAAGIKKAVLDSLSKNCSPNDCIIEILDYWLRNSTKQPTWSDVAGILKLINHSQLASAIESVYVTGTYNTIFMCNFIYVKYASQAVVA
jgi:hypothetical protein